MCVCSEGDVNARATCIPSHVHHILFEVLKNALRATAVKHGRVADSLPPVRVRIAKVTASRRHITCVSMDVRRNMPVRYSESQIRGFPCPRTSYFSLILNLDPTLNLALVWISSLLSQRIPSGPTSVRLEMRRLGQNWARCFLFRTFLFSCPRYRSYIKNRNGRDFGDPKKNGRHSHFDTL